MALSHNLGFPRVGDKRQLKLALESYWRGDSEQHELLLAGQQLRQQHWQWQQEARLDWVPVGDFAFYDHMLQLCQTFGVIPARYQQSNNALDQLFELARGQQHCCNSHGSAALEMTKWFDTNYHYLVPELESDQTFTLQQSPLLEQISEAQALGVAAKPVIVGPLTFLWLSKSQDDEFDKLTLLPQLLNAYQTLLQQLVTAGCEWVQIDEPVLSLELPAAWLESVATSYQQLTGSVAIKLLLTNYFGSVADKLELLIDSGVQGLHIDAVRAPQDLTQAAIVWPLDRVLSVGVIDGRNVWRADLNQLLLQLRPLHEQRGDRLWLAPSCSLLHVPVDADQETQLDPELKGWLAFARQKLSEVGALTRALNGCQSFMDRALFTDSEEVKRQRHYSSRVLNLAVRQRAYSVLPEHHERQSPYAERVLAQRTAWNLPLLPSTTIGSFPQTAAIRQHRAGLKRGTLSQAQYDQFIADEIALVVEKQEALGLDVFVHGEPERNDMVEYFGERLDGVAVSELGWVQSYGSRCVKPPLIYGDVARSEAMTVRWSLYAQSLTDKPMKGMLTGPVTILNWSFVRSDMARSQVAEQIALAVRDEVQDLEKAGIGIIQIDEPALREGLPLRQSDWAEYLQWSVDAFRLSANGVKDTTQIHTHMCYCEFDDILESIAALDADVISIEASRSNMTILKTFSGRNYANAIGLGLYDIHSPNVPQVAQMTDNLQQAASQFPWQQLWANPDCGLKTRGWPETDAALKNMVTSTEQARAALLAVS